MTTGDVTALLARLDAMDRERREARDETARALKELRQEMRAMRDELVARLDNEADRVSKLELARAEDVGERRGRGGVVRLVVATSSIAAAVSAVIWAVIDHT